jgi:hypothetical protein
MYNKEIVNAIKTSAYRNYSEGYVSINTARVNLNPTAYTKRIRVFEDGK